MNYIEQLISEWYEYKGYYVRRNIKVGRRKSGGYDGELDIVAFNPVTKHLVHVEPSADTDSWIKREQRYRKKFELGRKHIPTIFEGLDIPKKFDQEAVFMWGGKTQETLAGGRVLLLVDYFKVIKKDLASKRADKEIVPENLSLIRTLHLFIDNLSKIDTEGLVPITKPGRRKSSS